MSNEGTVALNNYLQATNQLTSLSWQDSTSGPKNAPQWTSTCKIAGQVYGIGTGTHKHIARNMASTIALNSLRQSSSQDCLFL
ncbi:hypothetical protein SERLA73DRAFT_174311 [Serpula lacrymans var. lacrymans S7.3]|uniref:DRBM domain-containing protein n=2 Tax=Serpula lacrymans var. lacrymans TaxID=341189 RepID=F8PF58_SERL3|nr:uncharacterized protein SERLADRAFT_455777 [Serpula lacrymans var. lacrymans S7.9]EGO05250.1 hypothetical protein SERLA73DRAFT_174311 [Serpula lacrymans var. lacrymans S7.3]EGO31104.1 hypothetical protein SERLADRAFT_455777 [Serpula lacrymans var. lacrymans S7.9]